MNKQMKHFFFLSSVFVGLSTFSYSTMLTENFETVPTGQLPKAWKSEATNTEQTTAIWKVEERTDLRNGKKILSLSAFKEGYGGNFNLFYTDGISFLDGEISVQFKANRGNVDQGGGIMWRVQDNKNYYVARFNPLEDNFRFYSVIKGVRHELCSANVHLDKGWHGMKIVQDGNHFEGFLNGKKLLECENDAMQKSGGVGVWTKADAATSFDDFKVKGKE